MKGYENMIKVTARDFIKAECVDEFLAITKELVEKTNAFDTGCISYEMFRDISNPLNFVMIEEWEDKKFLDDHMKSAHFLELIPKLGPLCAKPSEITLLEKAH
jgi:quinol monooxygenase YgiN